MKNNNILNDLVRRLMVIGAACLLLLANAVATAAPGRTAGSQAERPEAGSEIARCDWNRPGVNPFMGDVIAAVDRYTDMSPALRERFKERMRARNYDELVTIKRDTISGKGQYGTEIRDMYFGNGRVCRQVSRAGWSADMQERGLVYCEQNQCILVPTICRNVSRISRQATGSRSGAGGGGAAGGGAPGGGGAAGDGGGGGTASGAAGPGNSNANSVWEAAPHGGGNNDTFASVSGWHGSDVPWAPRDAMSNNVGVGPMPVFSSSPGDVGYAPSIPSQNPNGLPPILSVSPIGTISPGGSVPPAGSIPPVPEPSTWGMLLAGLAIVGLAAQRRRATAQAATTRHAS